MKTAHHIGIYIDTNCINAKQNDNALNELEQLEDEGVIDLEVTDTMDVEFDEGKGYPEGKIKSQNHIFSSGPIVLGHSKAGMAILGSQKDDDRLGRLLEVLFSKKQRSEYTKNQIRDAMHLSTTVYYGGTYFITRDKAMLNNAETIKTEFGLEVLTPELCLEKIRKITVE